MKCNLALENNIETEVRMEENYIRFIIYYYSNNDKRTIQKKIEETEKFMNFFPLVVRQSNSKETGSISLEVEQKGCDRLGGDFFEELLQKLKV
jgi:hypothetical protein